MSYIPITHTIIHTRACSYLPLIFIFFYLEAIYAVLSLALSHPHSHKSTPSLPHTKLARARTHTLSIYISISHHHHHISLQFPYMQSISISLNIIIVYLLNSHCTCSSSCTLIVWLCMHHFAFPQRAILIFHHFSHVLSPYKLKTDGRTHTLTR